MNDRKYPPTTKVKLPPNSADRWRRLCWKSKSNQKTVSLMDADRVLLVHLEELVDSLLELGSSCVDVFNRFQHLEISGARPEVERVYTAFMRYQHVKDRLENIDPDLKVD